MWKIEGQNQFKGGKVEWNSNYRLRNFTCGKYLSIQASMESYEYALILTEFPNDYSLFRFISIEDNQSKKDKNKFVNKDAFFRL